MNKERMDMIQMTHDVVEAMGNDPIPRQLGRVIVFRLYSLILAERKAAIQLNNIKDDSEKASRDYRVAVCVVSDLRDALRAAGDENWEDVVAYLSAILEEEEHDN